MTTGFYLGGSVNKQIAALVVATVVLTAVTLAGAQQQTKIPKIGWLGVYDKFVGEKN